MDIECNLKDVIPHIVHYCWFGNNPIPDNYKSYIESWHRFLPEWKFMEWNENNCNVRLNAFVREAYYMKKYAFVSDYFRMKALYEYGGVYLDTDVEMVRNIAPLVEKGEFVGLEVDNLYGTGIICVRPQSAWVARMLDYYESRHFFTWKGMLNTWANTIVLTQMYPNKTLPVTIYPIDYLSAKSWKTGEDLSSENTYTVHHYAVSWSPTRIPRQILRFVNYYKFIGYYLCCLLGKA